MTNSPPFPPPTRGSVAWGTRAGRPPRSSPRPRGDQSSRYLPAGMRPMFPPPTRGSVGFARSWLVLLVVPPAHAGISRLPSIRPCPFSSSPRPRGDQSAHRQAASRPDRFPPPTRGSVVAGLASQAGHVVPPAHAGISRRSQSLTGPRRGFPPPTRGSVDEPDPQSEHRHVPPAHAGISRPISLSAKWLASFPPPTRGSVVSFTNPVTSAGVPPAHAGISRPATAHAATDTSSPRPRGDQSSPPAAEMECTTFPPPTRGSVGDRSSGAVWREVPPAHAGISRPNRPWPHSPPRSPRPRGDQSATPAIRDRDPTVPPAHAGISRSPPAKPFPLVSSPRPRGDQSCFFLYLAYLALFPPPTRGSVGASRRHCSRRSVPPAHAGISRVAGTTKSRVSFVPPAHAGISRRVRSPDNTIPRSPRPRGDQSLNARHSKALPAVPPAHAGISRSYASNHRRKTKFPPPTRGSVARPAVENAATGRSPRPRGDQSASGH